MKCCKTCNNCKETYHPHVIHAYYTCCIKRCITSLSGGNDCKEWKEIRVISKAQAMKY